MGVQHHNDFTTWSCDIDRYSMYMAGLRICIEWWNIWIWSKNMSGWWYTYPSEKYESQLGWLFPIYGKIKKKENVPKHQSDVKDAKNIGSSSIFLANSSLSSPRSSHLSFVEVAVTSCAAGHSVTTVIPLALDLTQHFWRTSPAVYLALVSLYIYTYSIYVM